MTNIHQLLLLLLLPPACCGWIELRTPSYINIKIVPNEDIWTWKEAQSMCREKYTDLVTIRNQAESDILRGIRGWIGLYRNTSSPQWRWSRGDEVADFTNWENGQEPLMNDGNCAGRRDGGTWGTKSCDDKLGGMICFKERLLLVKEEKTWEEAVEHCRSMRAVGENRHYQLATLWTADDLAFAREEAGGATTAEVWTGLRYLAGHWMWLDGEQVLNQQLPVCPAQASCGALLVKGTQPIHNTDCQLRRNFFCSMKPVILTLMVEKVVETS